MSRLAQGEVQIRLGMAVDGAQQEPARSPFGVVGRHGCAVGQRRGHREGRRAQQCAVAPEAFSVLR